MVAWLSFRSLCRQSLTSSLGRGRGLRLYSPGTPHQFCRFCLACWNTCAASNAEVLINISELVNFYGAHRAALGTGFTCIACFLANLRHEGRSQQYLFAQLMQSYEQHTAIAAAIAYTAVYIQGRDEAILIAFPQELDGLIIGDLTGHAMVDGPTAHIAHVKACFQHVFTMVAGIDKPVGETAWTGGDAPVSIFFDNFGQVLRGKGIIGQCRRATPYGGKGEPQRAQPIFGPIVHNLV